MKFITKHIPNTLTCLNLLCGSIGCVFALQGDFHTVLWLISLSLVFDFLDGFAARGLKAYSSLGKELDSLADLISFGLLPSLLLFQFMQSQWPTVLGGYLAYFVFLIPIFSALRLAKFNIDTRQSETFLGLPTPANALFWIGAYALLNHWTIHWGVVLPIILLFCLLMTSDIPLFSLKIKTISFLMIWRQLLLILIAITTVCIWGIAGISITIVLYILLSILFRGNHKINS